MNNGIIFWKSHALQTWWSNGVTKVEVHVPVKLFNPPPTSEGNALVMNKAIVAVRKKLQTTMPGNLVSIRSNFYRLQFDTNQYNLVIIFEHEPLL